jgi:uncharacterized membrane protein YhaH (DUF805 family)
MSSLLQRHFSWKARISRRDFVAYPIAFFGSCLALGLWQESLPEGPTLDFAKLLIWPLLSVLMLAASKRCRDADFSPWLGIIAVLIPFGVLILLFTPGSAGPNRFGPSPRSEEPIQSPQTTTGSSAPGRV